MTRLHSFIPSSFAPFYFPFLSLPPNVRVIRRGTSLRGRKRGPRREILWNMELFCRRPRRGMLRGRAGFSFSLLACGSFLHPRVSPRRPVELQLCVPDPRLLPLFPRRNASIFSPSRSSPSSHEPSVFFRSLLSSSLPPFAILFLTVTKGGERRE